MLQGKLNKKLQSLSLKYMSIYADTKKIKEADSNKPTLEIVQLLRFVNLVTMKERQFPLALEIALYCANILVDEDFEIKDFQFIKHDDFDNRRHFLGREFDEFMRDNFEKYEERCGSSFVLDTFLLAVDHIKILIEPYPELTDFVFKTKTNSEYPALTIYEEFVRYRENLYNIVRYSRDAPEKAGVLEDFEIPTSLKIIDGKFKFSIPLFARIINGLPIERLKICQVCDRIFWVEDLRQKRCSKKCSDRHSKQKQRSNPEIVKKINAARNTAYRNKQRKNPNSKIVKAERAESERQQQWRQRRDQNFS